MREAGWDPDPDPKAPEPVRMVAMEPDVADPGRVAPPEPKPTARGLLTLVPISAHLSLLSN